MNFMPQYDTEEILDYLELYLREAERLPDRINPYGEMENILDGRDIIEEHKNCLSESDLQKLAIADEQLRRYPKEINALLGRDPKRHRERNNISRSHWWYIDESSIEGTVPACGVGCDGEMIRHRPGCLAGRDIK